MLSYSKDVLSFVFVPWLMSKENASTSVISRLRCLSKNLVSDKDVFDVAMREHSIAGIPLSFNVSLVARKLAGKGAVGAWKSLNAHRKTDAIRYGTPVITDDLLSVKRSARPMFIKAIEPASANLIISAWDRLDNGYNRLSMKEIESIQVLWNKHHTTRKMTRQAFSKSTTTT
jgi:hypothetical protein